MANGNWSRLNDGERSRCGDRAAALRAGRRRVRNLVRTIGTVDQGHWGGAGRYPRALGPRQRNARIAPGDRMTIDGAIREALREVVREELRTALYQAPLGAAEEPRTYAYVARWASISPSTIGLWVRKGLLPSTGKGRMRRVLCSDVRKLLDAMRDAPKGEPLGAKARAAQLLGETRARRRA